MNYKIEEKVNDLLLWSNPEAKEMMQTIAQEHGVSIDALAELVAWEREQQKKSNHYGMTEAFDKVFDNEKYWK